MPWSVSWPVPRGHAPDRVPVSIAAEQVRSYFLSAPAPLDSAGLLPSHYQKAIKMHKDEAMLKLKSSKEQERTGGSQTRTAPVWSAISPRVIRPRDQATCDQATCDQAM